jgi:hypothetical protein
MVKHYTSSRIDEHPRHGGAMKDLLVLLIQLIGYVCSLGFVFWIMNRFFGFSLGSKGVVIPTEWEAGVSFFVAAVICFAVVYFLGGEKKQVPPAA